jgi:peptidoglycan-associated lipoprotein
MKRSAWNCAVAAVLAVGLVLGGCAKKQVREEGALTPQPAAPKTAAQPPAKVTEGTLPAPEAARAEAATPAAPFTPPAAQPSKAEPPPPQTAALERAAERPVTGAGLPSQTTTGLQRIQFDFDQSALTAEAREILGKNAKYLQEKAGSRIRIEGHCDERGTTEYNLALGERRAKAAFQYLMDLGVDPNRMNVVSYGEEVPLDNGHNEAAWAKNRRAELVELQK